MTSDQGCTFCRCGRCEWVQQPPNSDNLIRAKMMLGDLLSFERSLLTIGYLEVKFCPFCGSPVEHKPYEPDESDEPTQ